AAYVRPVSSRTAAPSVAATRARAARASVMSLRSSGPGWAASLTVFPAQAAGAPLRRRLPCSLAPPSLAPQSRQRRAPPALTVFPAQAAGAPLRRRLPCSLAPPSLAPQSRQRRAPPALTVFPAQA